MIRGRPIRFLVTLLGGWTALRLAMVLPVSTSLATGQPRFADGADKGAPSASGALDWMFPAMPGSHAPAMVKEAAMIPLASVLAPAPTLRARATAMAVRAGGWSATVADSLLGAQLAFADAPAPPMALAAFTAGTGLSTTESGLPMAEGAGRWSGAAWMIWRDGDGASYARGPRLGASQAGVRVDYALAPGSALRPALYGRVSSALHGQAAAELAMGIAVRPPFPVPMTIAVERRAGVSDGGRSAFAIMAAGGIPPREIGHGFRLDGYAQAGMVGFNRQDGFADGRVTVERPLADMPDLAIGAGLWGGAQPGASRIDVGPQASLRLRLGGLHFRMGAEWREQVAGNALPSSGPALSIGTDF